MQELFLGLIFALGIPHCWCTCIAWKVQWGEATPFPPVNYFIIVRVCSDYLSIIRKATSPLHLWARSQRLKKSESAQIIWVKSEKLLAHSTFEPGPEQTRVLGIWGRNKISSQVPCSINVPHFKELFFRCHCNVEVLKCIKNLGVKTKSGHRY